MRLGLLKMLYESLLQFGMMSRAGHLRQRAHQLVFRVKQILKLFNE
jgi:hypothetical protein